MIVPRIGQCGVHGEIRAYGCPQCDMLAQGMTFIPVVTTPMPKDLPIPKYKFQDQYAPRPVGAGDGNTFVSPTYTAADLAAAVAKACAEERERCAKVADARKAENQAIINNPNVLYSTADDAFSRASEDSELAAAIRAMT